MSVNMTLREILDDEDMREHVENTYLKNLCSEFPEIEIFSSDLDPKRLIANIAYKLWDNKKGLDKGEIFDKILDDLYGNIEECRESSHPLLTDYMSGIYNLVKDNRELIFKMSDEFVERMKKARDVVINKYTPSDDMACHELFDELVDSTFLFS